MGSEESHQNNSNGKHDIQCQELSKMAKRYENYYESLEIIGRGSFSIVRKCVRLLDNQLFAVKIIHKTRLDKNELILIRNEIFLLSKIINHPNVIKIIDIFETKYSLKIILELCQSNNLNDVIQHAPNQCFNEPMAANIILTIAKTLKYLHGLGIVHRDLKPENILFSTLNHNKIKITDFGLSHYKYKNKENKSKFIVTVYEGTTNSNETGFCQSKHLMSTRCGTPYYVAPEVLTQSCYGNEVDLWSLGVILYILLSGKQPFHSHSISNTYQLIINEVYAFPQQYFRNISNEAIDLIKKLLCVNVKNRITINQLLIHPWILKYTSSKREK